MDYAPRLAPTPISCVAMLGTGNLWRSIRSVGSIIEKYRICMGCESIFHAQGGTIHIQTAIKVTAIEPQSDNSIAGNAYKHIWYRLCASPSQSRKCRYSEQWSYMCKAAREGALLGKRFVMLSTLGVIRTCRVCINALAHLSD